VQGVGPRVALAILAGLPPEELVRAISAGDVARLKQIKGVGGKLAERLALELREKITELPAARALPAAPLAPAASSRVPKGTLGEVYGALLQLGFKPPEFEALLEDMDAERPVEALVRDALAALRRK
jgi:Holliday junction DNA helicase RuvA